MLPCLGWQNDLFVGLFQGCGHLLQLPSWSVAQRGGPLILGFGSRVLFFA